MCRRTLFGRMVAWIILLDGGDREAAGVKLCLRRALARIGGGGWHEWTKVI